MSAQAPVLWHLKVSHYNEKARWALDYKAVPHLRRAAVPGTHRRIAQKLTGGSTLPVLVLDGHAIGDSTRIIEALEQRYPDPPLYPSDADERRRALQLEDFFDERLGPAARLLFVQRVLPHPAVMLGAFVPDLTGVRRLAARATYPLVRRRVNQLFELDDAHVAHAWEEVHAAGKRFRATCRPSGYLVGDAFTVADLTVASLVAPVVAPAQFQYPQPQRDHASVEPLRRTLADYGLVEWTREIYARHRGASAEVRQ